MYLLIDTHTGDRVMAALVTRTQGVRHCINRSTPRRQSTRLLPLIDALLRKARQPITTLKGIGVVRGPGGFTAVRIGVATANALGYALQIPVVGISKGDFTDIDSLGRLAIRQLARRTKPRVVTPLYDRLPNITKPKHPYPPRS